MKALKEGKLVKSDKPLELPKRMKELMERAKFARGEQRSTGPVSFKEMMLKRSTIFRNIVIEKNKEVSHD
jgi:hypothetical protein